MVIFDQLRISDDGKKLYLNMHINGASYFDDIYLDELTITTADQVSETNPDAPTSNYIYKHTFERGQKSADMVLTAVDFMKNWETEATNMAFKEADIPKTLFFVYVKVYGTPDECTPCGMDKEVTVAVLFDINMFYQMVMQHTRELADTCTIPKGFIDLILLWNGFKAAVETDHYNVAVDFWKKMFVGSGSVFSQLTNYKCGCHG
jgi:hypothetical protein